jgi:hypothetical protein
MAMSEGTFLCCLLTIVTFIWGFLKLVSKQLQSLRFQSNLQQPKPKEVETTAAKTPTASVLATTPTLTAEEERQRLEAQLEAYHREEWCKKFEEEETARYFREKYCEYEFKRQWDEARRLEEARNMLREAIYRRECLQIDLLLNNAM